MIQAVVGTVGGGKTLYAVLMIRDALARGCHVSTNIHLVGWNPQTGDIDYTKGMFKHLMRVRKVRPSQLQYLDFDAINNLAAVLPAGTPRAKNIVVLDEVNEWFDTVDRDKIRVDSDFRNIQRFFRQSRKVHTDIYLVLQDFATLNNRIRNLVSHVMTTRDCANLRAGVIPIGWFFRNFFYRQVYDNQSKTLTEGRGLKGLVRKEVRAYEWYNTLETYGGAIVGGGVVGEAGEIVPPWYKTVNPVWWAVLGQCITFLCVVASFFVAPFRAVSDRDLPNRLEREFTGRVSFAVSPPAVVTNTVVVGTAAPVVQFEVGNWKVVRELGKNVIWLSDGRRYGVGDFTEYGRLEKISERRLTFATTNGWRMVDWVYAE